MRLALLSLLLAVSAASAGPRSANEVAAFKRENPCPSTGKKRGPCPGSQVDHANPLCAGGSDTRDNFQWMTVQEHAWKTRSDIRMCRLHRSKG